MSEPKPPPVQRPLLRPGPRPVPGGRWSALLRVLLAGLLRLVAPPSCAGCALPGTALCERCRAALLAPPRRVAVTTWPNAPPTVACARYEGTVATCVNAWKERGRHDLEPVLGTALARAVAALPAARRTTLHDPVVEAEGGREARGPSAPGSGGGRRHGHAPGPLPFARGSSPLAPGPLLLVPVPASRAARRRRGADGVLRLARHAAALLRADGLDVRVLPALAVARVVADQSGLSATDRARNMRGAFRVRRSAFARPASAGDRAAGAEHGTGPGAGPGPRVVVVDDVLTTGATVRAAAAAVSAAGGVVVGVACMSTTPLRRGLSAPIGKG